MGLIEIEIAPNDFSSDLELQDLLKKLYLYNGDWMMSVPEDLPQVDAFLKQLKVDAMERAALAS